MRMPSSTFSGTPLVIRTCANILLLLSLKRVTSKWHVETAVARAACCPSLQRNLAYSVLSRKPGSNQVGEKSSSVGGRIKRVGLTREAKRYSATMGSVKDWDSAECC